MDPISVLLRARLYGGQYVLLYVTVFLVDARYELVPDYLSPPLPVVSEI